ncbi:MAG: hypothetical protein OEX07_04895, partial [Gammaproteobacteria bacterium]|nr:hypothetical protein [Gammaproteobacteria bacterium]
AKSRNTKFEIDDKEWESSKKYLLSALELSPDNPEYLAMLGNLYEWRVVGQSQVTLQSIAQDDSPDSTSHTQKLLLQIDTDYRKALDYYRQALVKRPAFGFYWANIAVIKSILGEVDEEFYLSVDRSLVLGAWDPGVQLKIADATLSVWYLLNDEGWTKMISNIERGLTTNAKPIMNMAKRYQVINQVCGKLNRTDLMLQYCK